MGSFRIAGRATCSVDDQVGDATCGQEVGWLIRWVIRWLMCSWRAIVVWCLGIILSSFWQKGRSQRNAVICSPLSQSYKGKESASCDNTDGCKSAQRDSRPVGVWEKALVFLRGQHAIAGANARKQIIPDGRGSHVKRSIASFAHLICLIANGRKAKFLVNFGQL